MVEVLPLRGVRYSPGYVRPEVFAPPYDVVGPAERERLLSSNAYNVVGIDLGPRPEDPAWYAQAARTLARWMDEGVLQRDETPAFYGYQQHFILPNGRSTERAGFVGRVRLSPWGQGIHRHEHTRAGPRMDRLRLTRAVRAQLSPVFGLYRDATAALRVWLDPPAGPSVDFLDADGVRQVFWPITDPSAIAALTEGMATRDIVIADGHHRYETALTYRDERRAAEGDPADPQPYDYVLMYLCAAEDPGLCILPTHRVVSGGSVIPAEALLESLATDFRITRLADEAFLADAASRADGAQSALAVCLPEGRWLVQLRDPALARRAAVDAEADLAELDVAVLQNLILAPRLGVTPEALAHSERVSYTISEAEACDRVRSGQAQAAFILNPTSVEQVWRAARRGYTMPQKSTYFYPKLLTGLVISLL